MGLWGPPLEPTFLCREACGGDSIPLSLREAVAAARAWLPRVPPGWYMALGLDTGTATCMEKFCWGNAVGYKRETNTYRDIYTQTLWVDGLMVVMASLTDSDPGVLFFIEGTVHPKTEIQIFLFSCCTYLATNIVWPLPAEFWWYRPRRCLHSLGHNGTRWHLVCGAQSPNKPKFGKFPFYWRKKQTYLRMTSPKLSNWHQNKLERQIAAQVRGKICILSL